MDPVPTHRAGKKPQENPMTYIGQYSHISHLTHFATEENRTACERGTLQSQVGSLEAAPGRELLSGSREGTRAPGAPSEAFDASGISAALKCTASEWPSSCTTDFQAPWYPRCEDAR